MDILVTGGTGYIGSHACVALLEAGHRVTIVDNLANSQASVVDRIATISGRAPEFVRGDIRDARLLDELLSASRPDAVMHFAGLKAVGESVQDPLRYYEWNVGGSLTLLRGMAAHGVRTLVFSSSATVYGDPQSIPLSEDAPVGPANPYGQTKAMIEQILADLAKADGRWRIARLRYFNPVGAHESGLLGEAPQRTPNNLMPFATQVAAGLRERLSVYGGDYPTPDGTGVRDYIHVQDLVEGHLAALEYLIGHSGVLTVNLGTGRGYSVLEVVRALEAASGRPIPYDIVARRPGDIATCYADPSAAWDLLGWQAERGLDQMCVDAWRWEQNRARL